MKVTGVSAHSRPQQQKRLGYVATEVGMFLFAAKGTMKRNRDVRRIVVPGVACPYCRGSLRRLDPRDGRVNGRVIAMTVPDPNSDRVDVVVDPLPRTHWVVTCPPCRAQFVTPKRQKSQALFEKGSRIARHGPL